MTGGAASDGGFAQPTGLADAVIDGDVRYHLAGAQGRHDAFDIEQLVGGQGDAVALWCVAVDERQCRVPFGRGGGMTDIGPDREPVAVSIEAWPVRHRRLSRSEPLRNIRATGSVVGAWVSVECFFL